MAYNEQIKKCMNENKFTIEHLKAGLLKEIDESLEKMKDIDVSIDNRIGGYIGAIQTLKSDVISGRISYQNAEDRLSNLTIELNVIIKNANKPWWRKLI